MPTPKSFGLQFVSYCLRPWADLLEGAFTRVLLSEADRKTYFLEHNFDDLVRGNIVARIDAMVRAVGGPIMTPDEGRAIGQNLPPIPGGDKLNQPQGAAPAPLDPRPASPNLRAVS